MPVVVAAVCPHPPLLVPSVAAGAAGELDTLREACDTAVSRVLSSCDEVWLLTTPASLPSGREIGRYLLGRVDRDAGSRVREVLLDGAQDQPPRSAVPIGLLCMADGSARRTAKAPGALHPAAAAFDDDLAGLLAAGRPPDLAQADEQWCRDAPVFAELVRLSAGATWERELLYADAPYGVGYFVATWVRTSA